MSNYQVQKTQNHSTPERGQEPSYLNSWNKYCGQLQHQSVNHQPENSKSEDGQWERKQLQEGTQSSVDQPDHYGGNECRPQPRNEDAGNNPSNYEQADGTQKPMHKEPYHRISVANENQCSLS